METTSADGGNGSRDIIKHLLQELRPASALPVPPDLIIDTDLNPEASRSFSHSVDTTIFAEAASLSGLSGRVIVFDLDDTLLNTNFICKDSWHFPAELGVQPPTAFSIDYQRLRHPLGYWLKAGWRRPRRMQYDSGHYPFLRNPDVEAQLRPGALALLHGLKSAGATLVLATISARRRLDFLFARLPALKDAFLDPVSERLLVAAAEDLARYAIRFRVGEAPKPPKSIDCDMAAVWQGGCQAHRDFPLCFNIKSLPALHAITGIHRLDLLVDDSTKAAGIWERVGLEGQFLKAPRLEPYGLVVTSLLGGIIKRLNLEDPASEVSIPQLALGKDYPWVRFEDPLYFPLVHLEDTLTLPDDVNTASLSGL